MQSDSGISIIIPVYNSANYIGQCLGSLLEQTYANYEIICVDNGSTDTTPILLDEYSRKNSRIKVLHVPRCSAGMARNYGMEQASRKYLLFLDADDFFEAQMLKSVYDITEDADAQICLFGARRNYGDSSDDSWNYINMNHVPDSRIVVGKRNPYIFEIATAHPWNKLFLRSFVQSVGSRFQDIGRCNDVLFVYQVLTAAEKIIIEPEVYVNYRQHDKSLQATADESPLDWCVAYSELKKVLVKRGDYEDLKVGFQNLCLAVTWYNFNIMKTYTGFFTLYQGLLNIYFRELDLEELDQKDVYDYNYLSYEFISDMKDTSPEETIWNRSHRMIYEMQQSTQEKLTQKDSEIAYLKKCLDTVKGYKKTSSIGGIKGAILGKLPGTRRFIERRLSEQDEELNLIKVNQEFILRKLGF